MECPSCGIEVDPKTNDVIWCGIELGCVHCLCIEQECMFHGTYCDWLDVDEDWEKHKRELRLAPIPGQGLLPGVGWEAWENR